MTKLLSTADPDAIAAAARLLREGELVVFPTDTLYGLGALASDGAAINRLYEAKERPRDKAIPVLLADVADLSQIVREIPPGAQSLIDRHWPGPLTLVLPKRPDLPPSLSTTDGVAVRIPDCDVARKLIRAAGGAVATTSANLAGQPPAQTAADAMQTLNGRAAAVLDDGPSPGDLASTVLDCTVWPPRLLRPGPVSPDLRPV